MIIDDLVMSAQITEIQGGHSGLMISLMMVRRDLKPLQFWGGIDDGIDVTTKIDDFSRAGAKKIINEILKWIKEMSGLI